MSYAEVIAINMPVDCDRGIDTRVFGFGSPSQMGLKWQ